MTGMETLLVIFSAVAIVLGFVFFAMKLIGARRGTNSGNLEYGVMPAAPLALGLGLIDHATGWPGLPGGAYPVVFVILAAIFCWAILRAARQ